MENGRNVGWGIDQLAVEVPCTTIWHAYEDACPYCASLNGKTWKGELIEHSFLMDEGRPVWNYDENRSLAHPNCRCFLEVTPEIDEKEIVQEVGQRLNLSMKTATDIQQLRMNLREVSRQMGSLRWEIVEVNLLVSRYLSIARRIGLPEDIQQGLVSLQRLQIFLMQCIYTLRLYQAALLGGLGPIGWLMLAGGAVSTALTVAEPAYDGMRGT